MEGMGRIALGRIANDKRFQKPGLVGSARRRESCRTSTIRISQIVLANDARATIMGTVPQIFKI